MSSVNYALFAMEIEKCMSGVPVYEVSNHAVRFLNVLMIEALAYTPY